MSAVRPVSLGQPAFVTHVLDRAAHLRSDDAKLLALEASREARAYVVHRDSLVVKQTAQGPQALLTIDEALKFGANPGTIFWACVTAPPCSAWASAPLPWKNC